MGTKDEPYKLDKPNVVIHILFPGDKNRETLDETNTLGHFTYPRRYLQKGAFTRDEVFVKGSGFTILEEIIAQDRMDIIEKTTIVSSTGRTYSLETILEKLGRVDVLK